MTRDKKHRYKYTQGQNNGSHYLHKEISEKNRNGVHFGLNSPETQFFYLGNNEVCNVFYGCSSIVKAFQVKICFSGINCCIYENVEIVETLTCVIRSDIQLIIYLVNDEEFPFLDCPS